MKTATANEVRKHIGRLVQAHIMHVDAPEFQEVAIASSSLKVAVRGEDGVTKTFEVCVTETQEPLLPPDMAEAQAREDMEKAARTGCCQGTRTCNEASDSAPVEEELAAAGCTQSESQESSSPEARRAD